MDRAVYYHLWSDPSDPVPADNLRVPLLMSMATLRGVAPDVPAFVLELGGQTDWGNWPERLGFTVEPALPSLPSRYADRSGYRNLCRQFDLAGHARGRCKTALYVDCDVFFLRNPFPELKPLIPGQPAFDGYNSGVLLFQPDSDGWGEYIDVLRSLAICGLQFESVRALTSFPLQHGNFEILDEALMAYVRVHCPALLGKFGPEYNFTAKRGLQSDRPNPAATVMFHANGLKVRNPRQPIDWLARHARGAVPFLVSDLYETMKAGLGAGRPEDVFGGGALDWTAPFRAPLNLDLLTSLSRAKRPDGIYDLVRALGGPEGGE